MGKKGKKAGGNLGKSLIRDRFGSTKTKRNNNESMLHTAEINDGYDWGRLNLQSVTEESSFQEFLSTAELAGTEFTAEKLNIKFVNPSSSGLLSKSEKEKILEIQERNKGLVKIPRRPKWNTSLSAQELHTLEKEAFLEWRRNLAKLQEVEGLILTPYERNLEFWRQLWRVVERSDVVVQIVDARNPLLFRCEDLECYVKEINPNKLNMILLNKADFLTDEQREAWAKYFTDLNVRVAFFSATLAAEKQSIQEEDEDEAKSIDKNDDYNRGFMTQNGQPDNPRSARYILKDFVNGRLLYCVAPPTFNQERFHMFPPRRRNISANRHVPPRTIRVNEGCRVTVNAVDRKFFQDAHIKKICEPVLQHSTMHAGSTVSLTESVDGHSDRIKKPWKIINKHVNKNKREKARRLYAHLDQH
ncbi:Large subunit GTPase 1 like protein [Trachymyrmex zeteki]|uniref:Large subunit GTPase 1 like protein n=1 Tax=Mycetomoellerius zeteki TaxID=64791 RepID=A0A151WFE1_9HYME|nr:Large subunit GTPase 1 like protein [Trachymyrmex zeteki]